MTAQNHKGIYTGAEGKKSTYDLSLPNNWNKKLIIFIHGYMGYKDWGAWNLVSSYFTDHNYGFLKYNVSHNGCTIDAPTAFEDLEAFSFNNYVFELQDFEAITNFVQESFDEMPDIYIIGHSRGGGIALLQSANGFVKKIATWAAISSIGKRFPIGKPLEDWKNTEYYYRLNGRTGQQMPHHYSQYENYIKYKQRLNIQNYCENSNTPTLVIHGTDDESVKIEEGEEIAAWTQSKLIRIPGEKHTFGSSEPWHKNTLPKGLAQICKITLDFFNQESSINTDSESSEKLSLLSDLVKMAKSDDQVRDIEFQFLLSIAGQLGITRNEFKKLFEEHIAFNPPKLESDRILQFQRLVLLMNIDLNVDKEEIDYIKDLGIRMGLHPSATTEVLNRMHQHENKVIPPEELIQIFKTYHN